jgi:putative ABC transport system permease protein
VVISALTRKLFRDIVQMRGQFLTIALVVACGVGAYISTVGTFRAIDRAKDRFYEEHRFADVWAPLERAPRSIRGRIEAVDGVHTVETRIVTHATLPMPGLPEPASATVVSVPASGEPALGTLFVREGRLPDPTRPREVVVSEPFAKAHGLRAGRSRIKAVIEGELLELDVVGLALSPEHVFTLSAAIMMPDDRRYGVLWMSEPALAAASRMEGAFNDVALRLQPGASPEAVVHELDRMLVPWGGRGAYARKDQPSHRAVEGELAQLQGFSTAIPVIFLGVAAFLLNVVLSRVVELQRRTIAVLRALGYRGAEVALHFLELVVIVVLVGAAIGVPIGWWVGDQWTRMYQPYFRFPAFAFELDARTIGTAVAASLAASLVGALRVVRAVSRLAPAEAMSPPAPPVFGSTLAERVGVLRLMSASARMVARETLRRPARLLLSSFGIALAMAVVIVGSFQFDAIDGLMDMQFGMMMREDLSITLRRPVTANELSAMRTLPGVRRAEGSRTVGVRFRAGSHTRTGALTGQMPDADLRRVVEWPGRFVPLDREGIAVSRKLAEVLELSVGDTVDVEALEGAHPRKPLRIVRLVDDLGGLAAYAPLETVAAFMDETPVVSSIYLSVDPKDELALDARLRAMRNVAGVGKRADLIDAFRTQTAESMALFTRIITAFAAVIAIGIVYNNARVALSTRAHELASLRVLGFTRGEVSAILLGELALQVALAIPVGFPLGKFFAVAMMSTVDPEQYRFPLVVSTATYAFSASVVVVAAVVSALIVRRRVDHLDLIGVLKTRE